jgi:hypothetical protein
LLGSNERDVGSMNAATLWTGWDPGTGSSSAPEEFVRSRLAAGEVLFELLALAGRGFRPPRYLTVGDPARDGTPAPEGDASSPGAFRRSWSVEYRGIAQTAPADVTPYAIYLLGVDPPKDATDAELETFNDFYTNVHLREVAERRGALRAERFERVREILPPVKGAPRFLAVYEVDEAGASRRRHVGPPYSKGPEVWQRHTTPWRLWYRRITG